MAALKWLVTWALLLLAIASGDLHAATRVEVVDTWPQGADVALAGNENFYLRLRYATNHPVRIFAQPYFQGHPAKAGSNPSRVFNGSGEALGWFFLLDPGAQVDEVRITAGDGSLANTPQVADLNVHVVAGDRGGSADALPAWVTTMKAAEAEAQRNDYEARMREPIAPADVALFSGFMLAVLATSILAFGLPAWALWKWRGGWRVVPMVPAAVMAFVALRIGIDISRDPTSHNLWPFELLQWGLPCVVAMCVAALVHRLVVGRAKSQKDRSRERDR